MKVVCTAVDGLEGADIPSIRALAKELGVVDVRVLK